MNERSVSVKIPLQRVGVLIGPEGQVKKAIEDQLGVTIHVDSQTGAIDLRCPDPDPSPLLRARDMVLAIGRGFSPERAYSLFNEEIILYIIDLQQFFRSPSDIQRVKSRIIGKNGKTRRIIEEDTQTWISIYGNTVSIIGDIVHLEVAREAIERLMKGVLHRNVYRYLERKREALRTIEMELWKPTLTPSKKEEEPPV